jgi:MerR family transcriptional regulator, thiopeptide resistance regulator
MQRGLAEMYVVDPRFAAHYDAIAPGLAQYVHDAIVAPTGRHG